MRDGPRGFPQNFSCSAVLRCRPASIHGFAYGALTRCGRAFQRVRPPITSALSAVLQPRTCQRHGRFGLLRVRSPLLAQSFLLSLPAGTEMFQFPAFAPHKKWCRDRSRRVPPFGHRRVIAHLPLTAAFRSLSRPSSPPRATGIPHAPLFAFPLSLAGHVKKPRFARFNTLDNPHTKKQGESQCELALDIKKSLYAFPACQ